MFCCFNHSLHTKGDGHPGLLFWMGGWVGVGGLVLQYLGLVKVSKKCNIAYRSFNGMWTV